jgi:hypothetical protein
MAAPINLAGQRFGRLVAQHVVPGKLRKWFCICDCGNILHVPTASLRDGSSASCGCSRLHDLTGRRFGRLRVLSRATPVGVLPVAWAVVCECGTQKIVDGKSLRDKRTISCGCYMRENNSTHGQYKHPLFHVWHGMIQRCYNPQNQAYPRYGGRGIHVYSLWREDPARFFEDMGPCPDGMSLDRIDNSRPYSPGNCRWATPKQQARNRRSSRMIIFLGQEKTLAEWSELTGIGRSTIAARIDLCGWTIARALSTPV